MIWDCGDRVADDVMPRTGARLRCRLSGVAPDAPLERMLVRCLGDAVALAADGAGPEIPARWRRMVRGTALAWFADSETAGVAAPALPDDVLIDLWGIAPTPAGPCRHWRIVDGDGVPLLAPYIALDRVDRPPYVVSLYLTEATAEGWRVLSEAHIGSRSRYRKLLDRLAEIAGGLITAGLRASVPGPVVLAARPAPPRDGFWVARRLLRNRLLQAAARWYTRLTVETWVVGIVPNPPGAVFPPIALAASEWLRAPRAGDFLADPSPWPGRKDVILAEQFDDRVGAGILCALHRKSPGGFTIERLDFDIEGHASFPIAWRDGESVYCLPETAARRRTVLYRLPPGGDGPIQPVVVLGEDMAMADPTLFRLNGLYWLAYTDADRGMHDHLCLRYAEALAGPWHEHRLNPVKIDVRSARPAGLPFMVGDMLYRPAQDCSRTYGGALVLNQVMTCTPDRFEERVIRVYQPDPEGPYPHGLHTMSFGDGEILIDAKRFEFGPRALAGKLRTRFRRYSGR